MTDLSAAQAEPRGIGGWLILPVLYTILAPAQSAYSAFQGIEAFIEHASRQSDLWIYLVVAEIVAVIVLTVGWIVALVMLFRRKRSYPGMFMFLVVAAFIIGLIDVTFAANMLNQEIDSSTTRDLVRSFLVMVVWGAYMHESKRVKNTFVN